MDPLFIAPDRLIIQGVVVEVIRSERGTSIREPLPHSLPETKRPKGGCELIYKNKELENEVISNTKPVKLRLLKKYGTKHFNKLLLGDNLNVLRTLYDDPEIRGKINLIYIDPPFGTGQDFIGYDQEKTYSDRIINSEFLEFLRKRLVFLKELLSQEGSIYVHIDQKIGHYVKILMDEVFGEENFRNDITRIKCNPKNFDRKAYGNVKDVIYLYSKSKSAGDKMYWSDYRETLSDEEASRQFPKMDKLGRLYATTPLHAKGETKNGPTGQPWNGLKPPRGRHWRYDPTELTKLDEKGLIEWSSTGNPRKIIYADENRGKKIQDIWDFKDPGFENSHYPTEKNEDLLRRIILASTKEGDVVLDCFAGSGTTLAAAEKLNRNWIGIDANKGAIQVSENRLLNLNSSKKISFSVLEALTVNSE
jgi:adenine-specific DNA-methyltransferase